MTVTDKFVLSSSSLSADNLSLMMVRESSIGTIVNRLFTSKLTILSSSSISTLEILFTKCVEFLIYDSVLPTNGDRIRDSSLASWYVGEPMMRLACLRSVTQSFSCSHFVSLIIYDCACA